MDRHEEAMGRGLGQSGGQQMRSSRWDKDHFPRGEMRSCEVLSRGHSVTQVQVPHTILPAEERWQGEAEVERLLQTPGEEQRTRARRQQGWPHSGCVRARVRRFADGPLGIKRDCQ